MTNTAYVFDVNTGRPARHATPARRAVRPAPATRPEWTWTSKIYHNWGITATPVIDVATNTIYVTTFGKPNANSPNNERNNMLWILDANTLADKKPPVLIEGNADNGGGGIANGFTTPYQKMRAGLGLLTDAGGNKAVVVSFSINGENPRGPGHGFVVAYDVRGLNRDAGFTPTPAIWNVTPGGGAGGVWMSGSGPAIDGDDIYLATGNGMDPGTIAGNFGESFVKLRYYGRRRRRRQWQAEARGLRLLGRVQRFWTRGRRSGPWRRRCLPDPRARQPRSAAARTAFSTTWTRTTSGRTPGIPSSISRSSPPICPTRRTAPPVCRRRRCPIRTGRSSIAIATSPRRRPPGRAITFTEPPCTWSGRRAGSCMSGVRTSASKPTTSTSPRNASPRSAARGRRWRRATCPRPAACLADASSSPRTARPRAQASSGACTRRRAMPTPRSFTARSSRTTRRRSSTAPMKQLFHSDANPANNMGNFAKYSTPVVANGKVYVGTFSNKVVQYGL